MKEMKRRRGEGSGEVPEEVFYPNFAVFRVVTREEDFLHFLLPIHCLLVRKLEQETT